MTAVTVVASIIMGLIVGWWLTVVIATTAMSHSQERMQRKVRYWQAETAHARAVAERLAAGATVPDIPESESGQWPWVR